MDCLRSRGASSVTQGDQGRFLQPGIPGGDVLRVVAREIYYESLLEVMMPPLQQNMGLQRVLKVPIFLKEFRATHYVTRLSFLKEV